jgi:hypothetical protein
VKRRAVEPVNKVKIPPVLRHEDIWSNGGIAPPFLTSALDGGEWSASRPCCFTTGEIAPGTHWVRGWVGPRAGLDAVDTRKMLPLPGIELPRFKLQN